MGKFINNISKITKWFYDLDLIKSKLKCTINLSSYLFKETIIRFELSKFTMINTQSLNLYPSQYMECRYIRLGLPSSNTQLYLTMSLKISIIH